MKPSWISKGNKYNLSQITPTWFLTTDFAFTWSKTSWASRTQWKCIIQRNSLAKTALGLFKLVSLQRLNKFIQGWVMSTPHWPNKKYSTNISDRNKNKYYIQYLDKSYRHQAANFGYSLVLIIGLEVAVFSNREKIFKRKLLEKK